MIDLNEETVMLNVTDMVEAFMSFDSTANTITIDKTAIDLASYMGDHFLTVQATDAGGKSCSGELTITLADISPEETEDDANETESSSNSTASPDSPDSPDAPSSTEGNSESV